MAGNLFCIGCRQGKGELTELTFGAADNDLAAMEFDDGTDNVQSEANAALVLTAGTVGFIESLEDFGDLLFGNAFAGVFHRDVSHVLLIVIGDLDVTSYVDEFHRILHQIIDHLMDQIFVSGDHHTICIQTANIQLFFFDGLFKGKDGAADHLIDVKIFRLQLHFAGLQTGDVQHGTNQSGQAFDFAGHDGEIMPLFFRWDGAVHDAVHEAADGGHWCFQLMRYIGYKGAVDAVLLCQRSCHVVECHGQLADFVHFRNRNTDSKITAGEAFRCGNHASQRTYHIAADHINDRKSNDDNTDGADQEHFQHFFEEVSQVTGIAGNKDHTGDLLVTDDQRQGNGVVLALINTAQIGDALIGQFLTDGCQNIGWNGAGTVGASLLTGADQRIAVDIGKENIRVDGLGDRDINIIQSGRYLVGTVHIDAEFLGSLQCIDCVLVQGRKTVILEVLRREAQEHDAQEANGQQNQTRAGEEVFSE